MDSQCIEKGNTVKGSRNLFCNVAWPNVIIGQFLAIQYTPFVDYTYKACCIVVFDLGLQLVLTQV